MLSLAALLEERDRLWRRGFYLGCVVGGLSTALGTLGMLIYYALS